MITKRILRQFSKRFSISVPKPEFHLMEDVEADFPLETQTNKEEILNFYKELNIMRRLEIISDKLYKGKEIFGFCHLYDGQEAIALGMHSALNHQDPLVGTYRIHCTAYLRGISVFEIMAEMLGK